MIRKNTVNPKHHSDSFPESRFELNFTAHQNMDFIVYLATPWKHCH